MGKKQFIDKKGAQHFTVVHRSQHDPLVADGEASKLVLLPILPSANQKSKSKSKTQKYQVDDGLAGEEFEKALQADLENNAVKAAQFGINFGDDYDYCQHLKPMGQSSDAIFLAAPKVAKAQEKSKKSVSFLMPEEALASKDYISVGLMNQPAIPEDYDMCMDPEVIDALEALEDEAFLEDELTEDLLTQMDAEGYSSEEEDVLDESADWHEHFLKFKREQAKAESDDGSEDGGKLRNVGRRTTASKYTMTSSAMFRNKGLSLVDEQFERLLEEYDEDTDEDDECPQLVLREDFAAVADDFLDNFEVVGRRMVPRMEGETSADKFDRLRESLIALSTTKKDIQNLILEEEPSLPEVEPVEEEVREARWDCESILSTYSNIYNRPALVTESSTKIRINSRGFPRMETILQSENEDESESEDEKEKVRLDNSRVKGETAEEKKARKQLAKELKRDRREQKKANKSLHQQLDRQRQNLRNVTASTHQKAIPLE